MRASPRLEVNDGAAGTDHVRQRPTLWARDLLTFNVPCTEMQFVSVECIEIGLSRLSTFWIINVFNAEFWLPVSMLPVVSAQNTDVHSHKRT
jgi:hypothetical protein